jgi:molybdopterin/thiamine biosynthesis adenylyltransferase/ubiquitin-protein ligase
VSDIWFLRDLQRLGKEREAIANLEKRVQWLQGINWTLDVSNLVVEASIHAHGYDYAVKMVYPRLFPEVPPEVYPQDAQEHWSAHQYLHGALCLEWRPDTWHSEITGAQVLESAYTLLSTENPRGSGEHNVVPVQHDFSAGQILRGSYIRAYVAENVHAYLADLPLPCMGYMDCWMHWQSKSFIIFLQSFQPFNELREWCDVSIPKILNTTQKKGFFFKTAYTSENLDEIKNLDDLIQLLKQKEFVSSFFDETNSDWLESLTKSLLCIVLIDIENQIHCFLKISADSQELSKARLLSSDYTNPNPRTPTEFHKLSDKSVCIVGLGSIGSKIAISLARSGVNSFYLIDEDVFLPVNTCRNSLDWRNVGEYKVHAIAEIISCISTTTKVDVEILNVGGQESSLALDRVLKRLSSCDLIIDATANPRVFNLLAFTAKVSSKSLIWGEVFAGGIGGLIARSRPDQEPEPQVMKAAFYEFLSTQDAPIPLTLAEPYRLEDQSANILEASDADVTVIAGYITQLAIDTLLLKEPSSFPYSMYLIGLQKEWIFKSPFYTLPIDTAGIAIPQESSVVEPEVVSRELNFLEGLLQGTDDADPST